MWHLPQKPPTCSTIAERHSLLSLSDRARVTHKQFSSGRWSTEWKEKSRRAPQARQFNKTPEQIAVLHRLPERAPGCTLGNSGPIRGTHHMSQWLLGNPTKMSVPKNSDLTHRPPQPQYNSISSSASLSPGTHSYSLLQRGLSLHSGPSISGTF